MKKLADTIITVVITFLISLVLTTITNYITQDSGEAEFGTPIKVEEKYYVPIVFSNYSDRIIGNLIISIPEELDSSVIPSSKPINVSNLLTNVGGNGSKNIRLDGFEPKTATQILIPISSIDQVEKIRFINPEEVRFLVIEKNIVESPIKSSFSRVLSNSIFTSLVYGIVIFWALSTIEKDKTERDEKIKELREDIKSSEEKQQKANDDLMKQLEDDDKQIKKIKETAQRIKLSLIARISDYAKELEFWRDTIRKILYESGKDKRSVEMIIDTVTSSLKTYGTQEKFFDFNAIEVMARQLREAENKDTTKG
ncbi:MAG: hypothetical protein JNM55_06815 [Anaerolineales bacterium]|nr:hypothetical protein [Anaerolineales bacterium]